MREHSLAVLNLPSAEAARVGPVQARRMAFEADALETLRAFATKAAEKPDDHDANGTSGA